MSFEVNYSSKKGVHLCVAQLLLFVFLCVREEGGWNVHKLHSILSRLMLPTFLQFSEVFKTKFILQNSVILHMLMQCSLAIVTLSEQIN